MDKDLIVTLYLWSEDYLAIFLLKLCPWYLTSLRNWKKIVFLQIKNVNIPPHFMCRFLHRKVSWDLLGSTLCRSQPKVKFQPQYRNGRCSVGWMGHKAMSPPQVSHQYSLQIFLFCDISLCLTDTVLMGRFFFGGCEGPDEKSVWLWWVQAPWGEGAKEGRSSCSLLFLFE